jgi:hypothetical protein
MTLQQLNEQPYLERIEKGDSMAFGGSCDHHRSASKLLGTKYSASLFFLRVRIERRPDQAPRGEQLGPAFVKRRPRIIPERIMLSYQRF